MDYLQDIKEFHVNYIQPYTGMPVGANEEEIDQVERTLGFELPQAYREYLRWMGKDYEGIFVGSDWFITDILSNNEQLPELLKDNSVDYQLPRNYLSFFSHQGYMFAWFALPAKSENPDCWFYSEGEDLKQPRYEGAFTDILFKDMQGLTKHLHELEKPK